MRERRQEQKEREEQEGNQEEEQEQEEKQEHTMDVILHVPGDLNVAATAELLEEGVDVDGGDLALLPEQGPQGGLHLLAPLPPGAALARGQDGYIDLGGEVSGCQGVRVSGCQSSPC